jgi:ubiquinone/menaquinone biosynthesis C-methylase UbiE
MSGWHKKRRVMVCYDTTASIYDRRYAEEQAAKVEAALKNVSIEKEGLILDVGCGTGILFDHVADEADGIIGVDFSKKCLLQAKERIFNKSLQNVQLILADVDNMPFHNEVFNTVFAMTILQNMPSPSETLAEIKRVSINDALFVVSGLKKIFTEKGFERLLKNSQLNTLMLEDEKLKCYVAVCTNQPNVGLAASQKGIRKIAVSGR